MNASRHIRKLNRLLEGELGPNPLYRWIHSESAEFLRAMRVTDLDGNPQWDYRCPCGLNVSVHSASCMDGNLVIAEPKYIIRKIDPSLIDQWALCSLQPPPSERQWDEAFGTKLPYPKNGTWALVETETRIVSTPKGMLPGENFTMAVIRARQRTREVSEADLRNQHEYRKQRESQSRLAAIKDRIKDVFTVDPFSAPGTRSGAVSWGGVGTSPILKEKAL